MPIKRKKIYGNNSCSTVRRLNSMRFWRVLGGSANFKTQTKGSDYSLWKTVPFCYPQAIWPASLFHSKTS